ncbi:MAG: hypothetical protein PHQ47_02265 [Candidatus Portnoybacteria bacterium]|nr:hypothetical protein [Candidatus Portnoybacteria bacterium]
MATNPPKGKGRKGMVRERLQYKNPRTKLFTKANSKTGRFMDNKTCCGKESRFKGVKTE